MPEFKRKKHLLSSLNYQSVVTLSTEEFVKKIQDSHIEDIARIGELSELLQILKDLQKKEQELYEISVVIN